MEKGWDVGKLGGSFCVEESRGEEKAGGVVTSLFYIVSVVHWDLVRRVDMRGLRVVV